MQCLDYVGGLVQHAGEIAKRTPAERAKTIAERLCHEAIELHLEMLWLRRCSAPCAKQNVQTLRTKLKNEKIQFKSQIASSCSTIKRSNLGQSWSLTFLKPLFSSIRAPPSSTSNHTLLLHSPIPLTHTHPSTHTTQVG